MIASVLAVLAAAMLTQEPAPQAQDEALRVFYLNCGLTWCDEAFLRTEVTYVNWVRDRADAQVVVLVTTLPRVPSLDPYLDARPSGRRRGEAAE